MKYNPAPKVLPFLQFWPQANFDQVNADVAVNNYTRDNHVSIDLVKIGLGGQNCKRGNT